MRSERERRDAVSPLPSSSSDAARLRSPQEADEDAALHPWTRQELHPACTPEEESEALAFEEAAKAARQLRHTTSYRVEQEVQEEEVARMLFDERIEDLPRPGKADVYEFDADVDDAQALLLGGAGADKTDRAQRIQLQRARRAAEQERQRASAASAAASEALSVEYLPELKATLATREESLAGRQPPALLGAPLEIATARSDVRASAPPRASAHLDSAAGAAGRAARPGLSSSSSSSSSEEEARAPLPVVRPHAPRRTSSAAPPQDASAALQERMQLARKAAEAAAAALTLRGRPAHADEGGFAY
jgi:hypothetical protein